MYTGFIGLMVQWTNYWFIEVKYSGWWLCICAGSLKHYCDIGLMYCCWFRSSTMAPGCEYVPVLWNIISTLVFYGWWFMQWTVYILVQSVQVGRCVYMSRFSETLFPIIGLIWLVVGWGQVRWFLGVCGNWSVFPLWAPTPLSRWIDFFTHDPKLKNLKSIHISAEWFNKSEFKLEFSTIEILCQPILPWHCIGLKRRSKSILDFVY